MKDLTDKDGYADYFKVAFKIAELKRMGKKVHIIYDVDHVLVSGRSHDVFDWLLDRDVATYHRYEERQFLQLMSKGPWTNLAYTVGERYDSHDIVTARANFSALRVMFFCLAHDLKFKEMLFVGSQSKATSYGVILDRFKADTDWHVFLLDDSPRHVEDFKQVVSERYMPTRAYPLLTRRERPYTKKELQRHFDEVMQDLHGLMPFMAGDGSMETTANFLVIPGPRKRMLEMLQQEASEAKEDLVCDLESSPPSEPNRNG